MWLSDVLKVGHLKPLIRFQSLIGLKVWIRWLLMPDLPAEVQTWNLAVSLKREKRDLKRDCFSHNLVNISMWAQYGLPLG